MMQPETRNRLQEQLVGLYEADKGLQLAKDRSRQQLVNRLVRKLQNGTMGQATLEPEDEDVETMGVNVGNTVHHHYTPPPSKPAGVLPKLAMAAGLVAAGAGMGALPWVASMLKSSDSPPPAADTDTQYEIGLEVLD
jgi:hypothetical protein